MLLLLNFILVHDELKVAAKVAEKKILTLTSQVTERDEAIGQLKEETLAMTSLVTERDEAIRLLKEKLPEVLDVTSQVTKRDEEIRQLKEELHTRTKGIV